MYQEWFPIDVVEFSVSQLAHDLDLNVLADILPVLGCDLLYLQAEFFDLAAAESDTSLTQTYTSR